MKTKHKPQRGIALAASAFMLLSVPAVAMAQTDHGPQRHVAKTYAKKHTAAGQRRHYAQRNLYGWDQRPVQSGCGPYQNQFPPCQSTWPQGSPHYHGARPGPTFFDEE